MKPKLDPLIHQEVRLAILSLLIGVEQADFNFLKSETGTTQGNLSIQLKKLEQANYISITKTYKGNYPHTLCKITETGKNALEKYVVEIKNYLKI